MNTVHFPEKFRCKTCDKKCASSGQLKAHSLMHEPPTLQCPHCPKMFRRSPALREHLRVHSGETPFSCPFCEGYNAKSASLLNHHKKRRHPAEWANQQAERKAKQTRRYQYAKSAQPKI